MAIMEQILQGDAEVALRGVASGSVHCVVTSPPYWGLRDYGTATWYGGGPGCGHDQRGRERDPNSKSASNRRSVRTSVAGSSSCRMCGATRIDTQLGIESTPEEYVERLVTLFREVRRVIRDDGTVWLNLGDSYASEGGSHGGRTDNQRGVGAGRVHLSGGGGHWQKVPLVPKPKDLVGIPWRVAFALQADGWYLRSDIIWSKPNPMPDSVKDRPTKSHEYVFLLTKSRLYYYDDIAIQEPTTTRPNIGPVRFDYALDDPGHGGIKNLKQSGGMYDPSKHLGRNARSVWSIQPNRNTDVSDHFAIMPSDLVKRCILAGTSERGACAECGTPWRRDVKRTRPVDAKVKGEKERWNVGANLGEGRGAHKGYRGTPQATTNGWIPSCGCASDHPLDPCVVLDPFLGSGTTALVARSLGRGFIGTEINLKYVELARRRLAANPRRQRLIERWEV